MGKDSSIIVWQYIQDHHHRYGCVPTTEEIASLLRVSYSTAKGHLSRLVREGKLLKRKSSQNSYAIVYILKESA